MSDPKLSKRPSIEPLEARIAPAGIISADWQTATLGGPVKLVAGQGLSTAGANAGTYLLYVEKGEALVFFTDLNLNGDVDFNEVTGIAAGDGLRMVSFVDIHGDIATNLKKTTAVLSGVSTTVFTLTDSDNNPSNDIDVNGGDGRVILNNSIEKIEMRSLTAADLPDQNGDGVVDDTDILFRKAYTTYSIFGNIYAGRGFGAEDGGLIIDTRGATTGGLAGNFGQPFIPSIGSIKVGTAVTGEYFSFGVSREDNATGTFVKFSPPRGQTGADIIGVKAADAASVFNIDGLFAGDGGAGARGGNIVNVALNHDDTGGYRITAGNGGGGSTGGAGGSVLNFSDTGSETSQVVITTGSGGAGATGAGGNGGNLEFKTFNVFGNVRLDLGDGGNGFTAGGNGASLASGIFTQPNGTSFLAGNGYGTMHQTIVDLDPATPGIQVDIDPLTPGVQLGYTASIGTHNAIDFDGDGFGDFVYTTKGDSQLVVMFGDGLGGFRTVIGPDGLRIPDRFYLSGARNAEALTVADLNGDGHPDIATASSDLGSQAGVGVFLSKYEDINGDGDLSSDEDLNANGIDDFIGFYGVRYSNLAQLDRGDPDTLNEILPWWQSPLQISSLTSGDYDGDGKIELAALVTYYTFKNTDGATGTIFGHSDPNQVLVFLTPDEELNTNTNLFEYTGQFFMDFGTRAIDLPGGTVPASPRLPFILPADDVPPIPAGTVVIETTALRTGSTHDVIIIGVQNNSDFKSAATIDYSLRDPDPFFNAPTPPDLIGVFAFGKVDTNRDLSDAGKNDKKNLQDVLLQDFTVVDFDNDGIADLGVISSSPAGFLVGVKGNGTGGGTQVSGSDGSAAFPYPGGAGQPGDNPNDNQGNFFGDKGFDVGTTALVFAKSGDFDGDGQVDDLMILTGRGDFVTMQFQVGPQPTDAPTTATTGVLIEQFVVGTDFVANPTNEVFSDVYLPLADNLSRPFALVSEFSSNARNWINIASLEALTFPLPVPILTPGTDVPLGERGLSLAAGDGGDALIGKGGIGGLLGSGSKITTTTDAVTGITTTDLVGSLQITVSGTIRLRAGAGGDGFSTGGKGGSITGAVVRPLGGFDPSNPTSVFGTGNNIGLGATLVAGDGGRGVSGAGGDGGDLASNSIVGGIVFLAGDGGIGTTGGAGGDVFGNGTKIIDAVGLSLRVIAGNGGDGDKKGGVGGVIANFSPVVGDPGDDVVTSNLQYRGGAGGNAVAGPGGNGGSVTNSSPRPGDGIQFDILVAGGDGGTGTTGGNGGNVTKFFSLPAANSKKPQLVSFLGGEGGAGLSGAGGTGGSVSQITVTARGSTSVPLLDNYSFSRILAGDGGSSAGGKGGIGGSVSDLKVGALSGSFAIVSGAGGDGLITGGKGGDVLRTNLSLGTGPSAKGLVVAGAGGDATGFVPNPGDSAPNQGQNAYGGKIGIGGAGGNIDTFTQQGQLGSHIDLISGNGGNTVNYGTILDKKNNVGKGGSITKVKLAGDVGNLTNDNPNTPADETITIRSYNDVLNGQSMADWVNDNLRDFQGFVPKTLGDTDGNVGIVVGAAGRNKAVVTDPVGNPNVFTTQPATGGVNGSLIDIEARNIMSAVAGNVDLIASIQVAKNIRVLNGIVGQDKPVIGTPEYLDPTGLIVINAPVRDGRLMDGALIAKVIQDSSGKSVTLPGRVFLL